jgi:hypothetical protein
MARNESCDSVTNKSSPVASMDEDALASARTIVLRVRKHRAQRVVDHRKRLTGVPVSQGA